MGTGKTKNLAVIGDPIEHSLSPALQGAAIEDLGVDYSYIAIRVRREDLKPTIEGLRAMNFAGWNVTIPHKSAIIPYLDRISEEAALIGAVNTVVREGEELVGYNTDMAGFLYGLQEIGWGLRGKRIVLLGAGGAARAAILGLLRSEVEEIQIFGRNWERVKSLAESFRPQAGRGQSVHGLLWEGQEFWDGLADADLVVNLTPLGMHPKEEEMPPVPWEKMNPSALCYDVIYTPRKTRFLREAEEHGHKILNGEAMLAGQGAEAFFLWTGKRPQIEKMKAALRDALEGRA